MSSRLGNYRNLIHCGTALVMSLAIVPAASAATRTAAPRDTPEWGSDVVRVSSDQAGTVNAGSSGGGIDSCTSDDDSSIRAKSARLLDGGPPSVDYCVDLGPTDDSSGPYRVFFHLATSDDDESAAMRPRLARPRARQVHLKDGVAYLSFNIHTAVEMAVDTTGGDAFLGAIYDDTDTLVASDSDAADRLSTTLASGSYTLVITGTGLTGDFKGQVGVGTCDSN